METIVKHDECSTTPPSQAIRSSTARRLAASQRPTWRVDRADRVRSMAANPWRRFCSSVRVDINATNRAGGGHDVVGLAVTATSFEVVPTGDRRSHFGDARGHRSQSATGASRRSGGWWIGDAGHRDPGFSLDPKTLIYRKKRPSLLPKRLFHRRLLFVCAGEIRYEIRQNRKKPTLPGSLQPKQPTTPVLCIGAIQDCVGRHSMRRKYFGWAIAAVAMLGPVQAWGGDREIAEQIINRLKGHRDSGALQDFTLDMKVDNGVVLLKGSVSNPQQRKVVLEAADGIEGIASVIDEVQINAVAGAGNDATVVKRQTIVAADPAAVRLEKPQAGSVGDNFSFRQALATTVDSGVATAGHGTSGEKPGAVVPTAAMEYADSGSDQQVTQSVVAALGRAQKNGQLKGFGVDVKSSGGVVELTGRAASDAQRDSILQIASSVPGVVGVREAIQVASSAPTLSRLPEPMQESEPSGIPARLASAPMGASTMTTPYRTQSGQPTQAMNTGVHMGSPMMGAPVSGGPVPMAPYGGGAAAPRYDSPYLPNYAWPGYAAYPNYAAVTYPQQYSPSAWPYIGPFYPYPQVPLGWRKVALEWDDGWWHLDFTDR